MKELLESIVKQPVNHPDEARVSQVSGHSHNIFEIFLKEGDAGQVIGRDGKTIQSIRNIIWAIAHKRNEKVIIEIVE